MIMVIAILEDHFRPAHCDLNVDHYKPILSTNLTQVTGNGIHHPKTSRLFCQVLGAIGQ